jgi:hypothetical protein
LQEVVEGPGADVAPARRDDAEVTEPPRPKGLPAASTHCPTRMAEELPQVSAVSGARASTRSKARSISSSEPTTRAGSSCPPWKATVTRLAVPTTWLLVTMKPATSMTKPEPAPWVRSRLPRK